MIDNDTLKKMMDIMDGPSKPKKPSRIKECVECGGELICQDGMLGCEDCGTIHGTEFVREYAIEHSKGSNVGQKSKVKYFEEFLYKIQGMGSDIDTVQDFVNDMKKHFKNDVTPQHIRTFLRKRKYPANLSCHLPDIYYAMNHVKPTTLPTGIITKFTERYMQVVEYEKAKNIKLPFKKKYFARRFIADLGSRYRALLLFCGEKKTGKISDMIKYHKCYDELFGNENKFSWNI